ncbi:signal peptide peptidase SppA [Laspinema olomoucense]|uniref:Protease 4 n=1 Tax=Laspinema olomoucense D3b TaxID=2953688 RepID=A0ABT2NCE3_9CYAN|nr:MULTISPECIES: signal peptide peptidase SppA [unclassified Laspinema]MCT7979410.1 signal peptide peptidase SppA [Laspinema sp. D3b]MCT7993319.1 signal peptide peptidase SppA [Laspinema sp. D3c]
MRDFFKYTFASILGTIVGLGVLGVLSLGGLLIVVGTIATSSKDAGPNVENNSMLVFDLSMNITDSQPTSTTAEALSRTLSEDSEPNTMTLRQVVETIDAAREDDRILGIYLHSTSSSTSNGFATLREVRSALERFQDAGKTIIAYDQDWSEGEYYLASVSDEILLNPLGMIEMNGLSSETTFLTGGLQKYGVGVQVTRVGKYKSAVEPFVLTQSSPESRQQTEKLLSDIWGDFLTTVDRREKISAQQVQQVVNTRGMLMATEAEQQGFVDRLAYFDEVVAQLKELTGQKEEDRTFRQIGLSGYAAVSEDQRATKARSAPQIALVYAEGEIVSGEGGSTQVGGDRLAKQLRDLRRDEDVKAIVLRVNSPGGSATASEVIQREVQLIAESKPIVVSMGNVAASGGYWISSYGSKIFAQPNTITGSIGVFGMLLNIQSLGNKQGINWDVVKTGPYADIDTITRPRTAQEMAIIQQMVDGIYERFLNLIVESRNLPAQKVSEIAQGRVWSGQEAKQLGLVDELGGLNEAILAAAELAELGEDWKVEEYPQTRTFEQILIERLLGSRLKALVPTPEPDPLTAQLQELYEEVSMVKNLNDPFHAYTRLPFTFQIR